MSYKLFIPGPIAVSEKTLRAMAQPMIGHRSTDFVEWEHIGNIAE